MKLQLIFLVGNCFIRLHSQKEHLCTSEVRLIPLWMMTAVKPWLCVKHRRCLLIQLSVCLVAASLTGFGLIGVPTVRQYRDTRHFVSTICTVERSVLDNSSSVPCRHTESRHRGGLEHNSSFPCLTVRVGYEPRGDSTGEDAVTGAVLYKTYYSYSKCPSNKACSLYVCSSDRQHNVDHVLKFRDNYANTGQRFACFYKPGQRDVVLLNVTTRAGLTHALLWPSLTLLLGLAIGVCVVCRCQVKDKVKELHCRLWRPSGAQNTFTQIEFVRLNSAT